MFRRNADKIQNVTFWGIADDNTWLSEFSSGRPDHPCCLIGSLNPRKPLMRLWIFKQVWISTLWVSMAPVHDKESYESGFIIIKKEIKKKVVFSTKMSYLSARRKQ
jgi:hypothetical protein